MCQDEDRVTEKLRNLQDRIDEYDRLLEHLRGHDCSKETWTQAWDEANLQALKHDGKAWYYDWNSGLNRWNGREFTGVTAQQARQINREAAYEFAKQIEEQKKNQIFYPPFEKLAEVVFRYGKLASFKLQQS